MGLVLPFPKDRIHSLAHTFAPPEYSIEIYFDKEGFKESSPNVSVIAVRQIGDQHHVAIALACAHCLARRPEYRRSVRDFLRTALSDQCIQNPELRNLLHAEAFGTA